ncbi:N-acetylmuramoyl-L-alanine amidase [Pararhizobium sp. PWRC1-1]|uniref:N-acetylmuramoyl-L-alanine amidase n=1 Tax=Pararhizobium sp. PWRC1-1 TaxID=2804566 RepID=UPI003CE9E982
MAFKYNNSAIIPLKPGHSVSKGWTSVTGNKPMGVTWHWTAIESLSVTRSVLGGPSATSKGIASAHYGIGRTFAEGVDRYVSLENRSWHAGKNQVMRWDGKKSLKTESGARACIGIETCNLGYERPGVPAKADWIKAVNTDSKWLMKMQPWTDEQFEMMVAVGKEILARWQHIEVRHHHGHHDICPGYKQDVAGFSFAKLLRRIYDDDDIPDVWADLWSTQARQKILVFLGYDLGPWGADGHWGEFSQRALDDFQKQCKAVRVPHWTTFTCWDVHDALATRGTTIAAVTAG